MNVNVKIDFSKAKKLISQLSGTEFKTAVAKSLTDSAFEARKSVQSQMRSKFDRVTPYMLRSIQVKPATPTRMSAVVEPTYMGGKGVDPAKVMQHQVFGGKRSVKASERAFQRLGILQPGYSIVPGEACRLDAYGNIERGFMVQLVSYFGGFSEQGYKANMTDKRKQKLADRGVTTRGFKTINGVVYFVAWGRLRSGRTSHLPYGIWAKTGIHGSIVKPVIMFVKTPSYAARIDFRDAPVKLAQDKFNTRLRYHMRTILESR